MQKIQSALLDLYGTNGGGYGGSVIARSRVESVTAGGAYNADMKFYTTDDSNNLDLVLTLDHDQNATFSGKAIVGAGSSSAPSITGSNDPDAGLFWGGGFLGFTGGSANYMRLNDNGDLLHGSHNDTTLYNNTSGGGIGLMASNRLDVARATDVVATFNRTASDGQVIQIYRSGSFAGTIAAKADSSNNYMIIGKGSVGMQYASDSEANSILPARADNQSLRDAAIDLGAAGTRFKDLYLSGGVNFSANANATGMSSEILDDYEEGAWTPAFANGFDGNYTVQQGQYTKIGRQVFAAFHLDINSASTGSTGNQIHVSGLPFLPDVGLTYGGSTSIHGSSWATGRTSLNMLVGDNSTTAALYYNMCAGIGAAIGPTYADIGQGNLLAVLVYNADT